ncbi:AAA family ATPase [Sulfuricurvum sp.]|uniref:ATP-dependent nuclease n=1 Tax=Sulfuricurvum sp. TaxID=2025608 RepID=UPI00262EEDE6|nr:AAA family ATPase [Sulfuricurvum sp.]MDD3597792.1 AAA family ATPase [Sulfuricurvum sp.]
MYIDSITLENFQSFREKTTIALPKLTAFVGSNGTGKTAILLALTRLFGIDNSMRTICSNDFYVPMSERLEDQDERKLSIEVTLKFPELENDTDTDAIAETFRHMIIDAPGVTPYCRIVLEAIWYKTTIPGGDVEQKIFWILSGSDEITEDQKQPLKSFERSKIQVHYIPASRDPYKQLKHTAGSIMFQLLRSVQWAEETKEHFATFVQSMKDTFQSETGVATMQSSFTNHWQRLFTSEMYQTVNINPVDSTFEKILSKIEVSFTPTPGGNEESIERLSDGMKSLFYFTLICSVFDLENKILSDDSLGIDREIMNPPLLSIFAIEEPENHLSPHYIGRILKLYREIIETNRAQVLVTSHSPSIMKRIEPEEVRYLKLRPDRSSKVSIIELPNDTSEAIKYVKEAIKAYPELYFSKLVVLGEGDSEEIIIPKIAEAFDMSFDESFVSMVPLGGRFVNHFWKLLNQLEIPHITLLDYDRERGGGGWGRIKYVLNQLLENGKDRNDLIGTLSDDNLNNMHNSTPDEHVESQWIEHLKRYDVYFSHPIDIDFMMLEKFSTHYMNLAPENGGPNILDTAHARYEPKTKQAIASVLKKDTDEIDLADFTQPDHEKYYWYRYLFLGRGKPTSHLEALVGIALPDLRARCPSVLEEVVENIHQKLSIG